MKLLAIGGAAGLASGLLGIGGGLVMVPMLVLVASFPQHEAHATSLAAGAALALAGGLTYIVYGEVDLRVAVLLAIGALAGAPLGARAMKGASESGLKIAFGCLMLVVAVTLGLP